MSRRCCCGADCVIFQTNWYPCPDELDADDWDVIEGTWAIIDPDDNCSGQRLDATGAGAMAICKHPTTSYPQYANVTLDLVLGSRPRLLMGVDYDPSDSSVDSYYYLEHDPDNNLLTWGHGTMGDGGVYTETVLRQITASFGNNLSAWLSGGDENEITFSGGWFGECGDTGWACATRAKGKYVGLMNGPAATATAKFLGDDSFFTILNHDDTPGVRDCERCDCQCGQFCVPRELTYTLTPADGADECCEGSAGTLPFFDNNQNINYCTWALDEMTICGYTLTLRLNRPTDWSRGVPCEYWTLEDGGWPGWNDYAPKVPDVCTCDPFYMRWDMIVSYGDMTPCGWRMEIFE